MTDGTVLGFLAVDKPGGITSRAVVDEVRRATGIRKSGHAGTLDPMATGLVIVALGRATRLIRFVQELPKTYLAVARMGVATDTLDADGEVTEERPMSVDFEALRTAASTLTGRIMQVPPMVSAVKVGGRRLHELAREGTEVDREPRPVDVHRFEIIGVDDGRDVRMRVVCGKGTYVRVLADDLAKALGGRAHLRSLRRTGTGPVDVDRHGVSIPDLGGRWREALLPPETVLADLPAVAVDEEAAVDVAHGRPLPAGIAPADVPGEWLRVMAPDGSFLAVHRRTREGSVPEVVLS
jgi:tRNA pseudouridine55 synthase